MIGVVACSNPSGNAALEGVVSGCGGVGTGELVIEIVADLWHLTEQVYRVAPTHLEGWAGMYTPAALRHTALYFAFMKHGSKVLAF